MKMAAFAAACLAFGGVVSVIEPPTVPDVEKRGTALFDGFDELATMGAYVVGSEGVFIGRISKGSGSDSLGNEYGAGSEYHADGLFNEYSKFGSEYSGSSAFCTYASDPPLILVKSGGTIYTVGRLTVNKTASTDGGQRINPYLLKAWLQDE